MKTNQPRLRPGNSGRERGMTIAEMSAKSTNARPESPRPSLCAVESAEHAGKLTATPLPVMVSRFWRQHEVVRQGRREARYTNIGPTEDAE